MISFEIPVELKETLLMAEMVATQVMRPKSRYYDEHEHELPQEYVSVMWPVIKQENKDSLERLRRNGPQRHDLQPLRRHALLL